MKKLLHWVERKIISFLLRKILKKSNLVKFADKVLDKCEDAADKSKNVIDDAVLKHLREVLEIPEDPK